MNRTLIALAMIFAAVLLFAWRITDASDLGVGHGASPGVVPGTPTLSKADRAALTVPGTQREAVSTERPASEGGAPPSASEVATSFEPLDPETVRGAVRLVAQVVDRDRSPVLGAKVVVARTERSIAISNGAGQIDANLEALEGWFETLRLRERKTSFRVHILAEGYAGEGRDVHVGDGAGVADLGVLILEPGSTISGRVRWQDGTPGRDVTVGWRSLSSPEPTRFWSAHGEPSRWSTPGGYKPVTKTDDLGGFTLTGIPFGECEVVCWQNEGDVRCSELANVTPGTPVELSVTLPNPPDLVWWRGTVVDADGSPAGGAVVSWIASERARDWPTDAWSTVTAEADGRFGISYPYSFPIDLQAHGESEPLRTVELKGVNPVTPGTNGVGEVELRLPGIEWIELAPIDGSGLPIPWSHVQPMARKYPRGESLRPCGASGVLRVPRPTVRFFVRAFGLGFQAETFGPFDPPADGARIELPLRPAAALRGLVLGHGRPMPGADLYLVQTPNALGIPLSERRIGYSTSVARQESPFTVRTTVGGTSGRVTEPSATTDTAGRFEMSIPQAGEYAMRIEAPGFPSSVFGPFPCSPESAGPEKTFELLPAGILEGRVIRAGGTPVEGTVVGISNGWGIAWTSAVGADGRYRFEGLQPGPWQLRPCDASARAREVLGFRFRSEDGAPVEWDFEIESGEVTSCDLDLSMDGSYLLQGSVRMGHLEPSGWEVTLGHVLPTDQGTSQPLLTTRVDDDGAYRLAASSGGARTVTLWGDPWTVHDRIELAPGANTWNLDVDMGRLVLQWSETAYPEGRPSWFARLEVETLSGARVTRFLTIPRDSRGSTMEVALPAGTASLVVLSGRSRAPGDAVARAKVLAGISTSVDLH